MEEAFLSLSVSLCDYVVLKVPLPKDDLSLHTDASSRGIGAVLNVCMDGEELPAAFFSHQLR